MHFHLLVCCFIKVFLGRGCVGARRINKNQQTNVRYNLMASSGGVRIISSDFIEKKSHTSGFKKWSRRVLRVKQNPTKPFLTVEYAKTDREDKPVIFDLCTDVTDVGLDLRPDRKSKDSFYMVVALTGGRHGRYLFRGAEDPGKGTGIKERWLRDMKQLMAVCQSNPESPMFVRDKPCDTDSKYLRELPWCSGEMQESESRSSFEIVFTGTFDKRRPRRSNALGRLRKGNWKEDVRVDLKIQSSFPHIVLEHSSGEKLEQLDFCTKVANVAEAVESKSVVITLDDTQKLSFRPQRKDMHSSKLILDFVKKARALMWACSGPPCVDEGKHSLPVIDSRVLGRLLPWCGGKWMLGAGTKNFSKSRVIFNSWVQRRLQKADAKKSRGPSWSWTLMKLRQLDHAPYVTLEFFDDYKKDSPKSTLNVCEDLQEARPDSKLLEVKLIPSRKAKTWETIRPPKVSEGFYSENREALFNQLHQYLSKGISLCRAGKVDAAKTNAGCDTSDEELQKLPWCNAAWTKAHSAQCHVNNFNRTFSAFAANLGITEAAYKSNVGVSLWQGAGFSRSMGSLGALVHEANEQLQELSKLAASADVGLEELPANQPCGDEESLKDGAGNCAQLRKQLPLKERELQEKTKEVKESEERYAKLNKQYLDLIEETENNPGVNTPASPSGTQCPPCPECTGGGACPEMFELTADQKKVAVQLKSLEEGHTDMKKVLRSMTMGNPFKPAMFPNNEADAKKFIEEVNAALKKRQQIEDCHAGKGQVCPPLFEHTAEEKPVVVQLKALDQGHGNMDKIIQSLTRGNPFKPAKFAGDEAGAKKFITSVQESIKKKQAIEACHEGKDTNEVDPTEQCKTLAMEVAKTCNRIDRKLKGACQRVGAGIKVSCTTTTTTTEVVVVKQQIAFLPRIEAFLDAQDKLIPGTDAASTSSATAGDFFGFFNTVVKSSQSIVQSKGEKSDAKALEAHVTPLLADPERKNSFEIPVKVMSRAVAREESTTNFEDLFGQVLQSNPAIVGTKNSKVNELKTLGVLHNLIGMVTDEDLATVREDPNHKMTEEELTKKWKDTDDDTKFLFALAKHTTMKTMVDCLTNRFDQRKRLDVMLGMLPSRIQEFNTKIKPLVATVSSLVTSFVVAVQTRIVADYNSAQKPIQDEYRKFDRSVRELATLSGKVLSDTMNTHRLPRVAHNGLEQQQVAVPLLVMFNVLNQKSNKLHAGQTFNEIGKYFSPSYLQLFAQFASENRAFDKLMGQCEEVSSMTDFGVTEAQSLMFNRAEEYSGAFEKCSALEKDMSAPLKQEFSESSSRLKKLQESLGQLRKAVHDAAGEFNEKLLPQDRTGVNWKSVDMNVLESSEIYTLASEEAKGTHVPMPFALLFDDFYLKNGLQLFCSELKTEKAYMWKYKKSKDLYQKWCGGHDTPTAACLTALNNALAAVKDGDRPGDLV